MAVEEYKSKFSEFWITIAKVFSVVPLLLLIGFGITYFVGTFRPSYNLVADKWVKTGISEFDNYVFNMTDSSGEEVFKKHKMDGTNYYPVRDRCREKGDPKGGCIYTNLLYYYEDIIWMAKENYYTIRNSGGQQIVKETLDGSLNYTRSEYIIIRVLCQSKCDELDGTWNSMTKKCSIQIYVDYICYRVIKKDNIWVLDTENAAKYPQNKDFSAYKSDGLGCDYGNNWHSKHYGKKVITNIPVQLRYYGDSYLAASAYTKSCSNDYRVDMQCFGPTQMVIKRWVFIAIVISIVLLVVEIIAYGLMFMIAKLRYKKAVRQSDKSNFKDDLLTATV